MSVFSSGTAINSLCFLLLSNRNIRDEIVKMRRKSQWLDLSKSDLNPVNARMGTDH